MKLLDGKQLAGYIKQQHAQQVSRLLKAKIQPKLAIVQVKDDPVINTYVRLKKKYGADIGVGVDVYTPKQLKVPALLKKLNQDKSVHGIIVQLPLTDPTQTDEIVNLIDPHKDVDALGKNSQYEPATPMAIMWLLSGYNIDLIGKKVLLIGRGKLVGAPLEKILRSSGISLEVIARPISDLAAHTKIADVIITATGQAGLIKPDMIKAGAVVIDAGTASESGKTVGDVAPEVYERSDLTITPRRGGVGPLTVCALFENLIRVFSAK